MLKNTVSAKKMKSGLNTIALFSSIGVLLFLKKFGKNLFNLGGINLNKKEEGVTDDRLMDIKPCNDIKGETTNDFYNNHTFTDDTTDITQGVIKERFVATPAQTKQNKIDERERRYSNSRSRINIILMCFALLILKYVLGSTDLANDVFNIEPIYGKGLQGGGWKRNGIFAFFWFLIVSNLVMASVQNGTRPNVPLTNVIATDKSYNIAYFVMNSVISAIILFYIAYRKSTFKNVMGLYIVIIVIILYLSGLMTFDNIIGIKEKSDEYTAPLNDSSSLPIMIMVMIMTYILSMIGNNSKFRQLLSSEYITGPMLLIFSGALTYAVWGEYVRRKNANDTLPANIKLDESDLWSTRGVSLVNLIISIFTTLFYSSPYSYRKLDGVNPTYGNKKFRTLKYDYGLLLNIPNTLMALISYIISLYVDSKSYLPLIITNLINYVIQMGSIHLTENATFFNQNLIDKYNPDTKTATDNGKVSNVLNQFNIIPIILTLISSSIGIATTHNKTQTQIEEEQKNKEVQEYLREINQELYSELTSNLYTSNTPNNIPHLSQPPTDISQPIRNSLIAYRMKLNNIIAKGGSGHRQLRMKIILFNQNPNERIDRESSNSFSEISADEERNYYFNLLVYIYRKFPKSNLALKNNPGDNITNVHIIGQEGTPVITKIEIPTAILPYANIQKITDIIKSDKAKYVYENIDINMNLTNTETDFKRTLALYITFAIILCVGILLFLIYNTSSTLRLTFFIICCIGFTVTMNVFFNNTISKSKVILNKKSPTNYDTILLFISSIFFSILGTKFLLRTYQFIKEKRDSLDISVYVVAFVSFFSFAIGSFTNLIIKYRNSQINKNKFHADLPEEMISTIETMQTKYIGMITAFICISLLSFWYYYKKYGCIDNAIQVILD